MPTEIEVRDLIKKYNEAGSYLRLFGPVPAHQPKDVQKEVAKNAFRTMVRLVHPDKLIGLRDVVRKGGEEIFKKLKEAYDKAETAIDNGTYHQRISSLPGFTLQSTLSLYKLEGDPLKIGDFSILYQGESEGKQVIIKVASNPTFNPWLAREAEILTRFAKEQPSIAPWVPKLIESFVIPKDGKHYRAVAIEGSPNLISVTDLIGYFPSGMEPQDAAWVCRRVLAQCGAASMLGLVHCAIIPDHLLVDHVNHDPVHIGWAHAIKIGEKVTHVIDRWRDYYPPEVFKKRPAGPATDVYMSGMTIIKLLGGDVTKKSLPASVPGKMASVVRKCVADKPKQRYHNGALAMEAMTEAARALWGKSFRKLVIPT